MLFGEGEENVSFVWQFFDQRDFIGTLFGFGIRASSNCSPDLSYLFIQGMYA
jgi:hypothetical protein